MKRHGKREIGDRHKGRLISQELIRIRDRESTAGVDTESEDEIPTIPKFLALKEDGDSLEYLVSGSGEEDECTEEHDIP
jgi:hypothetical protein